jgi:hypothetical protein
VLGATTIALCWLSGIVLGLTSVGLRTERGRRAVVSILEATVNRAIEGTMTIGRIGGSFLSGLEAEEIVIRGPDGVEVIGIPRLEVRYGLRDLLEGRFVLGRLTIRSPRLNLIQAQDGIFNLAKTFAVGGGRAGAAPFVAFSDVEITDGRVEVRTPVDGPELGASDIEAGPAGPVRVRRFTEIDAVFPYVRLLTPFPGQPVRVEVGHLSVVASDPRFSLVGLQGTVELVNDTLSLDLAEATMPDSGLDIRGSISWAAGPLLLDVSAEAAVVPTDPFRQLASEVPSGMMATGEFRIRSVTADQLDFRSERLDLAGLNNGGRATGRLGLVVGPEGRVTFRRTRLDLENFNLEYVRSYFDTLPLAGRITGRFEADGPTDELQLGLDVSFSDSLVPGWPATLILGAGIVSLGGPDDLEFRDYELRNARIDLRTARRLLPAVDLLGIVGGSGTLNGSWLQLSFEGDFRHRDVPLPESAASGSVRVDGRGDTLGVWADVVFDSLMLHGLASSWPRLGLHGAFAGRVAVAGYLDSLVTDADLEGPGGRLAIDGALRLTAGNRGAYALDMKAAGLDLAVLNEGLPQTSLAGHLTGAGSTGGVGGPLARVGVDLFSSSVVGVPIDSARLVLGIADSLLRLDGFQLWGNRSSASGNGSLGLTRSRHGTATLFAAVDSLGVLEPVLESIFGPIDTLTVGGGEAPSGSVWSSLRAEGSLHAFDLTGEVEVDQIERGSFRLNHAEGDARWATRSRTVRLEAYIDSLVHGGRTFGETELRAEGEVIDSLAWGLQVHRFGPDGVLLAGGRLHVDDDNYTVPIDSVLMLLATGVWAVDSAAVIRVSELGVDFESVVARKRDVGEVAVGGRVSFVGDGSLSATATAVPVQDVWALLHKDYDLVGGLLSGSFGVGGTVRAPILQGEATLERGTFGEFRAPYVEAAVDYVDQQLVGEVGLWRRGERILNIDVDLPLDLALVDVSRRRLPGALSVRAVAEDVDLSILDLVTPVIDRAGGTLKADFGITGSWNRPQLTGRIALREGSARIPSLGVRHRDLNGAFRLSGDTIRIDSLKLRSGRGSADVTGFVRLEELSRPVLQLQIAARNFHALDVRDFLSLTASGNVQLRGPLYQASLTGRGTITEGVLYFADLVEKNILNLEEFAQDPLYGELIDPEVIRQQGLGAQFENRFLDSLRVDSLRLEVGGDAWLRSSEANIQLQGGVTVNKLRDQYRLNGTLQTPRGTYRLQPRFVGELITREFTVTRGQLTYFGTPDLDASIDIDAQHVVRTLRGENVTVYVHLGGTIYDPQLVLTSDIRPPISEAEIIAYLFFGDPRAQTLTGAGITAQNQVVNQLLGALSGQAEYFLISDLRIPLDYFQIRPGVVGMGLSGTEIALGKRFGERWFVTVSPRLCPRDELLAFQNVGASLEYRFSRQWLLSVSGDPAQSCQTFGTATLKYQLGADVFWEKSY